MSLNVCISIMVVQIILFGFVFFLFANILSNLKLLQLGHWVIFQIYLFRFNCNCRKMFNTYENVLSMACVPSHVLWLRVGVLSWIDLIYMCNVPLCTHIFH
jgi:hypothetical protein